MKSEKVEDFVEDTSHALWRIEAIVALGFGIMMVDKGTIGFILIGLVFMGLGGGACGVAIFQTVAKALKSNKESSEKAERRQDEGEQRIKWRSFENETPPKGGTLLFLKGGMIHGQIGSPEIENKMCIAESHGIYFSLCGNTAPWTTTCNNPTHWAYVNERQ
jgi:phosphate/sulfate permease